MPEPTPERSLDAAEFAASEARSVALAMWIWAVLTISVVIACVLLTQSADRPAHVQLRSNVAHN